ncbi:hybrid sensor histidine kinase/response regulator transcription factor [Flavicella sediminum]|uniref:hybrid sensor histidine kinase/response regulator transcription factor n=1 Tax=Flavicella sediminum TaxID=2585141 RepID=UPI0011245005|nr:hybrid sensor histidine kinase/response regulator transcription factor [Flavicella sediminum]
MIGQFNNLKFENLDVFDGLSSSTCNEIFQDKEGYLWFGTIDGLNKYNGYEFEIFRSIQKDSTSISNNRINKIAEDNAGNLWIGTNNGLNLLNKRTNKFVRVNLYRNFSLSKSSKKIINDLLYDEINNILWVATNNGVIKIILNDDNLNTSNYEFSYYLNDQSNPRSLDHNGVNVILKDENGSIWIGTNGEYLNKYNANKDNFDRILIDKIEPYELNHIPKKVFIDIEGDFWIGNDLSNLILWNKKQNKFSHISIVDKNIPILDFYQDSNGLFWVSTDVQGIYVFSRTNGEVKLLKHIVNDFSDPFSLPNNKASKIFQDKKGVYWIGSYDKGVSKFDPTNYPFGYYYYRPFDKNSLSEKTIQSVLEDSKGRIWLSAYNGGLNLFDEKNKTFKHFGNGKKESNSLSSYKILYTFESHDGAIWICTLDGGLNKFDPKTNTFIKFNHNTKDSLSIGQNSVWAGVEDSKNRIWLALRTEGISLYNPKNEKFKNYKRSFGSKNSLLSDRVISLFIDSKDRLFVGTSLGLNMVDLKKLNGFIPEEISFEKLKSPTLDGVGINYITEDHLGNIWLGSDNGIYKLDKNLKIQAYYSSQNGLPNNLVVGLKEDNNHNLWITTKGGLSLLNPFTHQFKNFNVHDGLQGPEFQSKSIEKTKDGRIIIGGINGFNIFNPDEIITPVSVALRPQITHLKLNNKAVVAGETINGRILINKNISETKDLVLKHNENYLTFEFLALFLENPERVQYAYRLKGLDNDFINVGANRVVNHSNLEPGNYVFEVKASIDELWEESEIAFVTIKILPPLWKTWWAYLLYVVAAALLVWFFMRLYSKSFQKTQEHKLDLMKIQFFINVSHEFRTPLTLILNPLDKILTGLHSTELVKASALSAQRSAMRLLHLVNQLLDYRKMDAGMAPLQLEKGDIVTFGKDIFLLFKGLAAKKEIEYKFVCTSKKITALFDFDKIEKIITNLISNAIKFTDNGGEITITIREVLVDIRNSNFLKIQQGKMGDHVEIVIEDNGVGLNKEQLENIFSRFYNLDLSKSGTGIGLNFTKALVEMHKGEISVRSKNKKGTSFVVKLPLDLTGEAKEVGKVKNQFLINSVKSVEYDMLISNDDLPEEETKSSDIDSKSLTLLIVEDNRELRNHLKDDLSDFYKVKVAVNGKEGLKMASKYYPDLIISDVMMPEMDGFEMCSAIKSEFDTSHIPIILLTARSREEDLITGYEHGADAYLPKPFKMSILKARIKNLLEAKARVKEKFSKLGAVLPTEKLTSSSLDDAFIEKTTKVILDNISDPDFKLENILEAVGIGRSQFYRKIQSITGQNPSNFIRSTRLRYASELLLNNAHSIKEVTHMTGFNSTAYFSKTFRELFNVSPSEYIEQNKKD